MKFSRSYMKTAEFRKRQGAFDFATVALTVLDIAVSVRDTLTKYVKRIFKGKKPKGEKTGQMNLFSRLKSGIFCYE